MRRIRKLYYHDRNNTQKMISFLNNGDADKNAGFIIFNPFVLIHYILPLRFKFLPESYVLQEGKFLKGLVTVAPTRCPLKQMEIHKLLFEENNYADAGELIQYVVSRYKAMGTTSFIVRVDDYLPELIKMFITKCDFSQISYEKLWKIQNFENEGYDKKLFRSFRNSDAPAVASLYNEALLPHFRPLLGKDNKEFKDIFFRGLSFYTEYKYVMENKLSGNIDAYISIQTTDNENFIVDIVKSYWENVDTDKIIAFAQSRISKRTKNFNLFIKTKKYNQLGEKEEQEFIDRKFECVKNQIVLTHTPARIIKEHEESRKYTVLERFYGSAGANTTCKSIEQH